MWIGDGKREKRIIAQVIIKTWWKGVAEQPLPRRWRKKASGGNEGGIPKGKEKRRGGKEGSRRWEGARGRGETGGAKIGKQAKVFRGSPFRGIERDGRRERRGNMTLGSEILSSPSSFYPAAQLKLRVRAPIFRFPPLEGDHTDVGIRGKQGAEDSGGSSFSSSQRTGGATTSF